MKYQTATLEGARLDAAVALAEGWSAHLEPVEHWLARTGSYCTEWAAGGPLIEREGIWLMPDGYVDGSPTRWLAGVHSPEASAGYSAASPHGPTPLVAGMRARVAHKFGEEVDL